MTDEERKAARVGWRVAVAMMQRLLRYCPRCGIRLHTVVYPPTGPARCPTCHDQIIPGEPIVNPLDEAP